MISAIYASLAAFLLVWLSLNVIKTRFRLKVRYGDGEPIRSRITVRMYGSGPMRLAGARLFPFPHEARPFMRGRLTGHFERKASGTWVPQGSAAGASVTATFRKSQRFTPGQYRIVVEFAGYKSFRPVLARRTFVVR